VGLERRPLSLVSALEEVLAKKKVAVPVKKTEITALGIRPADHYMSLSIRNNWHKLRRQAALGLRPRSLSSLLEQPEFVKSSLFVKML
jgi:hypothetical protein